MALGSKEVGFSSETFDSCEEKLDADFASCAEMEGINREEEIDGDVGVLLR